MATGWVGMTTLGWGRGDAYELAGPRNAAQQRAHLGLGDVMAQRNAGERCISANLDGRENTANQYA